MSWHSSTSETRTTPPPTPVSGDGTYRHITEVVRPWCEERKIEFVEISARTGYLIRPKNQASRSLFQWLWDMDQIPVAGPNRICTRIAKVERFESWPTPAMLVGRSRYGLALMRVRPAASRKIRTPARCGAPAMAGRPRSRHRYETYPWLGAGPVL